MPVLVLVADADPFNLQLLEELCRSMGHGVTTAADGEAVLESVGRGLPDLLVMDAGLAGMDGLQVLRILRADPRFENLPVLLATDHDDTDARQAGLEIGADDYISRPYRTFEVQQRIRTGLRLRAPAAAPSDRHPAQTSDPETGAGTAAQLHMSLDYEFTRAVRYGHPLSCLVVRCSGEPAALDRSRSCASLLPLREVLQGCIRNVDHLFRSDAQEFTVLLPETSAEGCRTVVERVHATTAASKLPTVDVAAASYPATEVPDGQALWRSARDELA